MKAIFNRQSTRSFVKKEVDDKTIKYLLSAGMSAPNAGNQKYWEFFVLRSDEIRTEMNSCHGYKDLLNQVDVAFVICINKKRIKWDDRWQIDAGAAAENIITAATELGYATLWLELYPVEEKVKKAREILQLDDYYVPMMILPVGASTKELVDREPRFYPEYVHWK
ncbi:nitroreductase family protein [Candidatus Cloacimonadota bacterium]